MLRIPVPEVCGLSKRKQAEVEVAAKNRLRQILEEYLDDETMEELREMMR